MSAIASATSHMRFRYSMTTCTLARRRRSAGASRQPRPSSAPRRSTLCAPTPPERRPTSSLSFAIAPWHDRSSDRFCNSRRKRSSSMKSIVDCKLAARSSHLAGDDAFASPNTNSQFSSSENDAGSSRNEAGRSSSEPDGAVDGAAAVAGGTRIRSSILAANLAR